jgi:hypothetical protein
MRALNNAHNNVDEHPLPEDQAATHESYRKISRVEDELSLAVRSFAVTFGCLDSMLRYLAKISSSTNGQIAEEMRLGSSQKDRKFRNFCAHFGGDLGCALKRKDTLIIASFSNMGIHADHEEPAACEYCASAEVKIGGPIRSSYCSLEFHTARRNAQVLCGVRQEEIAADCRSCGKSFTIQQKTETEARVVFDGPFWNELFKIATHNRKPPVTRSLILERIRLFKLATSQ